MPTKKVVPYDNPYIEKMRLRMCGLLMKLKSGRMTPGEFKILDRREKWDLARQMKNVMWCCDKCGLEQGKKVPIAPFFSGDSTHCSGCDQMLTMRTGGGQNNPFNYTFKRLNTKRNGKRTS
jgi:hypothetical protein